MPVSGLARILVAMGDAVTFEALIAAIEGTPSRARTRLVAIDGRGGAGKSTLARGLAARIADTRVIEVDDFWLGRLARPRRERVIAEPGSDYDWTRLRDQVLTPLARDAVGWYQRYDWRSDALAEWQEVAVGGTVIVEGVFSIRIELASFYDFRVWVHADEAVCLQRERDGGEHDALWREEWMPAYRMYIEQSQPMARADAVIEGENGTLKMEDRR